MLHSHLPGDALLVPRVLHLGSKVRNGSVPYGVLGSKGARSVESRRSVHHFTAGTKILQTRTRYVLTR